MQNQLNNVQMDSKIWFDEDSVSKDSAWVLD